MLTANGRESQAEPDGIVPGAGVSGEALAGGIVFGTAGHIDHGKTSLVHALTGIDTDRLAEEKRRGISIDIGFAHMEAGGRRIALVDVPGHERFIKNMLAGVGGIQAVLLVVAADESVKPQTREHFDICRLLGIEHGIIVLTKSDLAGEARIAATSAEVRALCAGSFLERSPVVSASAKTGAGLEELKRAMAEIAACVAPRNRAGLARLPIDRSFSIAGFGTVVTGTLWNGRLCIGDEVEIHPGSAKARIRGLQVHGHAVVQAVAGQRTAVNLAGIDNDQLERGQVLTHSGGLADTRTLDAVVEWLPYQDPQARRIQVMVHAGAMETPAALKILDRFIDPVGDVRRSHGVSTALARIWTTHPLLALPNDRFVVRSLSPQRTIAGGTVVDPFPPLRTSRQKTLARLTSLRTANASSRIRILVEEGPEGRRLQELTRSTGLPEAQLTKLAADDPNLVLNAPTQRVLSQSWIEDRRKRLLRWLEEFHAHNPQVAGAPIAAARLGLNPALASVVMDGDSAIHVQGEFVALVGFKPSWNIGQSRALDAIERTYRTAGFQPPTPQEALRASGADPAQARTLLETLVKEKKLVRIAPDLIFHFEAINHIRQSLRAHKGLTFSVPEFKEWTQISRKYAIPLLEYLDREHVTRRQGDGRVVL
jgi:selenocysteine-specific elongation factor